MATKMTVNGVTTTNTPGQEQYEEYYSTISRKTKVQYDYRALNGKLFSCICETLEACRERRNAWLKHNGWEA